MYLFIHVHGVERATQNVVKTIQLFLNRAFSDICWYLLIHTCFCFCCFILFFVVVFPVFLFFFRLFCSLFVRFVPLPRPLLLFMHCNCSLHICIHVFCCMNWKCVIICMYNIATVYSIIYIWFCLHTFSMVNIFQQDMTHFSTRHSSMATIMSIQRKLIESYDSLMYTPLASLYTQYYYTGW